MKYFFRLMMIVLMSIFGMILILFVLYLFLVFGFNYSPLLEGNNQEFSSVNESIKNKVFVKEYYCPNKLINLPEKQSFKIKEAWIEHSWIYNKWSKPKINSREIFGLNIVFDKFLDTNISNKEYSIQWLSGKLNLTRISNISSPVQNKICIWSKGYNYDDTLNIILTKFKPNEQSYDTITSFILIKKNR